MKKLLCMLLVAMTLVSTFAIAASAAEADEFTITIDGIKDEAYVDAMSLDDIWLYWGDASNSTEPVDVDRVKNQLWFRWDDDFVYLYFQATSKDPLVQPAEGQTTPPDRNQYWFEQVNLYLDTAPSAEYKTLCTQGGKDDEGNTIECNHFCCNANDGEGKYYRVMARYSPAWDVWNNYYRSDEGMFMTYEQFYQKRCVEYNEDGSKNAAYDARYVEDPEGWYTLENGAAEAAGFIDYEAQTYGIELKYPRLEGEEYFQVNITNDVPDKEWEEEGPELSYVQSVCKAWWTNSDELFEIYYEDWSPIQEVPAEVKAVIRQRGELPDLDSIALEHKDKVLKLNNDFVNLTDEHKAIAEQESPGITEYITAAVTKVSTLAYQANLGDVNSDGQKNATDALVVLRASVGKVELNEDQIARADVNGDDKTDAKDALEILQFTVGKRKEFTVEKTLDI